MSCVELPHISDIELTSNPIADSSFAFDQTYPVTATTKFSAAFPFTPLFFFLYLLSNLAGFSLSANPSAEYLPVANDWFSCASLVRWQGSLHEREKRCCKWNIQTKQH